MLSKLFRRRESTRSFPGASDRLSHEVLSGLVTVMAAANPAEQQAVVTDFENDFARFVGLRHAIGANSGTTALFLALKVLGVGPGSEVITVANSWISTVTAIVELGATPRFADLDPTTGTLNADDLERLLTPRTKAVVPVHMYGNPADMVRIMAFARRHGLRVVEDACQAIGARIGNRMVGTFGDIGCISFHPSKLIGAPADGGMLLTDSTELAQKLRSASLANWDGPLSKPMPRIPSRLPALSVPFLRERTSTLPVSLAQQKQAYARWSKALTPFDTLRILQPGSGASCSFRTCMAICDDPDWLHKGLTAAQLRAAPLYTEALGFLKSLPEHSDLPETRRILEGQIRLPTGPEISTETIEKVARVLQKTSRRTNA